MFFILLDFYIIATVSIVYQKFRYINNINVCMCCDIKFVVASRAWRLPLRYCYVKKIFFFILLIMNWILEKDPTFHFKLFTLNELPTYSLVWHIWKLLDSSEKILIINALNILFILKLLQIQLLERAICLWSITINTCKFDSIYLQEIHVVGGLIRKSCLNKLNQSI